MTRVGYYDLYACSQCGQIHLKPLYASISISIPPDIYMQKSDELVCQQCGDMRAFSEYQHVGQEENYSTHMELTSFSDLFNRLIGRPTKAALAEANHPRNRYPYLRTKK